VVKALDPKPGELIYDMASAPGVKTALIMALTEGRAEVVASELYRTRLEKELRFLKSLNVDLRKVHLVQADSRNPLIRRADKVLLDAPCSSSGMVPNDPCVLLTLTPEKVKSFSELQREMLRTAVEISNYVTYSSCSVFPEEGEELVEGFKTLRLSFGEPFGNGVRFWPSQGTQGFFISVIIGRKG
jgi:tRNA and rRNA cytosine-C5-methylases